MVYLDQTRAPTRARLDARSGLIVVEFGVDWCGYCIAAAPHTEALLARHPEVEHIKVEDGRGRPLGRSFGVKLWPTFVLMRDGADRPPARPPRPCRPHRGPPRPHRELEAARLLERNQLPRLDVFYGAPNIFMDSGGAPRSADGVKWPSPVLWPRNAGCCM
jgi:thioredoxin 1